MQKGELLVTGQGSIDIDLNAAPAETRAHFKDDESIVIVPCNPQHIDDLEFEVRLVNGTYHLHLTWSVSSSRVILWEASY